MADESEDKPQSSAIRERLREWGFDLDVFEDRMRRASSEVKDDLQDMKNAGAPASKELKTGIERAWGEMEDALRRASESLREAREARAARKGGSGEEPKAEDTTATDDEAK